MTVEPPASQPPFPSQPPVSTPYGPPSGRSETAAPSGLPAGASQPIGHAQPARQNGAAQGKNTLGLASAIVGASGFLIGFLFTLIQLSIYVNNFYGGLGLLSGVQSVLITLIGLTAIALGIVALTRRALSKTFAAVGIALGAALIVQVLNGLVFSVGLPLLY